MPWTLSAPRAGLPIGRQARRRFAYAASVASDENPVDSTRSLRRNIRQLPARGTEHSPAVRFRGLEGKKSYFVIHKIYQMLHSHGRAILADRFDHLATPAIHEGCTRNDQVMNGHPIDGDTSFFRLSVVK